MTLANGSRLGPTLRIDAEILSRPLRAGLKSGRTLPRDVLRGYDEPVAALIVDDVKDSLLCRPLLNLPATFPAAERERILRDGTAALRGSVMPGSGEPSRSSSGSCRTTRDALPLDPLDVEVTAWIETAASAGVQK
jgi:hypothetical protein